MSDNFTIRLEGREETVDAIPGQSVLDACLAAGVLMPYNCRSGECAECRAELLRGDVEESPGADPAVFDDGDRAKGRILTCLCTPKSDVTIKLDLRDGIAAPKIERLYAHVERVEKVSESVMQIELETAKPMEYRAGQYFEWVLPDITPNRNFSAAVSPGSERTVFDVRLYPGGRVSDYVQTQLFAGDAIEIVGPYGHFGFTENAHRSAVCIVGSTGLAPLKAMIEKEFVLNTGRQILLFVGARTQQDMYDAQLLQHWAESYPGFDVHFALSEEPENSNWEGQRCLVTEAVGNILFDGFGMEAYVCGPPPMIDAAVSVLSDIGIDDEDVHVDRFSPAKST